MPYDESLATRLRGLLRRRRGIEERKMFGGLAFLVNGHMSVGIVGDNLVLRLGDELAKEALRERNTAPMDFTGRALKSMVFVEPAGLRTDAALEDWVSQALQYARSLPPKTVKGSGAKEESLKKTLATSSRMV
jgi:TfoX/Sxy family transcriptional regulator of competence genes